MFEDEKKKEAKATLIKKNINKIFMTLKGHQTVKYKMVKLIFLYFWVCP